MAYLEFTEGRFYTGVWYADLPPECPGVGSVGPFGKGGNVLASAHTAGEAPPEGTVSWDVMLRLRYYRDERIHDHEDEMVGWSGTIVGTLEEVEARADKLLQTIVSHFGPGVLFEFWPIFGNNLAAFAKLQTAPPRWMHMGKPETGENFQTVEKGAKC